MHYVADAQYYLTLSASTTLHFEITLEDSATGTVTVKLDGNAYKARKNGNVYTISIANIAANNLGVAHRVELLVGETTAFDVTASAVSYFNTLLSRSEAETTTNEQNAMAAMYYYYVAAVNYNDHPND